MSQPQPNSQQQYDAASAAGCAIPDQATRWILGRIKDGSQKALLLQQAPNMARSLPWASSAQPQRNMGPPSPTCALSKTNVSIWPQPKPQAPMQPPGYQGMRKGHQQLHYTNTKPCSHDSLAMPTLPSSTLFSAANSTGATFNNIDLSTAGGEGTGSQKLNRYSEGQSKPGPPPISAPSGVSYGGISVTTKTAHSSLVSSDGIFNCQSSQPKRPWEPSCRGQQPTGTGRQTRVVLRAALPIHWQQPQTQQQWQHQQQAQEHQHQQQVLKQHHQKHDQHQHQQQVLKQHHQKHDQHQQSQHECKAQLQGEQYERQRNHQYGFEHQQQQQQQYHSHVHCQSPVGCGNLNPGKKTQVACSSSGSCSSSSSSSSSSTSGACVGGNSHATSASRQGAIVWHSPISRQPRKQGLATEGACLGGGCWPALDGAAPHLDPAKPLKQQRCALEALGGTFPACDASSFSHSEIVHNAAAVAGTAAREGRLYTNNSNNNSPPLLPHHGALFGALSPEQTKVVNAPPHSSVCVLAGPGAGKTNTITARIVGLLLQGCRPLAALTFTKKSATELERRVRGGLEGVLNDRCTSGCISSSNVGVSGIGENDLFVGTFHSFFVRLLKSYGGYVGVPRDFRVLNQFQQLSILRSLIDSEKRAEAMRHGNSVVRGISAALRNSPDVPEVSSEEDDGGSEEEGEAQSSGFQGLDSGTFNSSTSKEAEELRKRIRSMKFIPELLQRERAAGSVLFRLFCQYEKHLREQQPPLLDFTDLTVKALRLLEPPATRAELGAQWPYLVVDEFQDTNSNQFKFICLLSLQRPPCAQEACTTTGAPALPNITRQRGGVTVVGDDDQSIYKWRGTHTGIFHEFRRNFPDYQEFFLSCNYRSVPAVVRHSLSLVSFNWPFRISKSLYSSHDLPGSERQSCSFSSHSGNIDVGRERESSIVIKGTRGPAWGHVHGAFLPSQNLEAQYILRYILCLKQHHSLRWDDFAVLCRTNSALLDLQNLLTNSRIQRAACSASSPFSTCSVHDKSENGRDSLGLGDPNRPVDPAVLFPAVELEDLELPAGGLPLSSTSSKRSGGAEVFMRPDVLDLLSYLRLAVDPHHDASFIRVLNRPPRRVGAKTLLALMRVQNACANRSTTETDASRSVVEMPWQSIPWAPGAQRTPAETPPVRASLFDALSRVLRSAGVKDEVEGAHPTEPEHADAVAAAEAARLRGNQVESLASFAKAICRLRSMSDSAVSVKAVLEVLLGPLGMGEFFAHRRIAQRARRGGLRDSQSATGTADTSIAQLQNTGTPAAAAAAAAEAAGTKARRSKRKATEADSSQPFGCLKGADDRTEASLRELSKLYGSEVFADVLGLLRTAEAYSPNWQQATAADCILRLLRDADAGRFLQHKVTNAITLSTIHQAKGLEWQVVIVARANEGTLPMGLGGSQPLADFVGRLISSFAEKLPKPEELRQAEATIVRQASGNEQHFHLMEERRVCYVALTRAKRFLLLTAPLADKANHPLNPSRFFREAGLVAQRQPQLPAVAVPSGASSKPDENQNAQAP